MYRHKKVEKPIVDIIQQIQHQQCGVCVCGVTFSRNDTSDRTTT